MPLSASTSLAAANAISSAGVLLQVDRTARRDRHQDRRTHQHRHPDRGGPGQDAAAGGTTGRAHEPRLRWCRHRAPGLSQHSARRESARPAERADAREREADQICRPSSRQRGRSDCCLGRVPSTSPRARPDAAGTCRSRDDERERYARRRSSWNAENAGHREVLRDGERHRLGRKQRKGHRPRSLPRDDGTARRAQPRCSGWVAADDRARHLTEGRRAQQDADLRHRADAVGAHRNRLDVENRASLLDSSASSMSDSQPGWTRCRASASRTIRR